MTGRLNVECQSEIRAEEGDDLTAQTVRGWLGSVPDGASLTPITVDRGNQRDPWIVLVGLRATWSESR